MLDCLVPVQGPYDFRSSVGTLRDTGMRRPTATWVDDELFKATSTPDGPATLGLRADPEGVQARAWGPGAEWALSMAPAWVGALDDSSGFVPQHPILIEQHRRHPGKRLGHTGRVFDCLLCVVFEQKVTRKAAMGSREQFFRAYGEPAPGPVSLLLPPTPERLKSVAYYDLHPMNVERKRASVLLGAARIANRLEETTQMPLEQAWQRLLAVPGIGPWTAGLVAAATLGDPDAIAVGDYHLKNQVAWLLAGEARGTDERMLELLQPYAGQRRRVIELLATAGQGAPRFGPRAPVSDFSRN